MKEDVVIYNSKFLLNDNDPIFELLKDLDGEYEAKWYEKIFDTNIYVGVDYHFDYEKLLNLFKKYEKEYSVEKEFGNGNTYRSYLPFKDRGVYDMNYKGLSDPYAKEVLNEDGTLTSNITIEVEGGKYKGWSNEQGVFNILFFKYNEHHGNTCNYAKFTSKDKMKEFFKEVQECIVSIDKDDLEKRIYSCKVEIEENNKTIDKIQSIIDSE